MKILERCNKSIFFRHSIVAVFFFCLALLFYKSIINVGFLSDDWHSFFIAEQGGSIWNFFITNIVGTRLGSTYAPMWNVLFASEYSVFKLWPTGYHLVSLFLYASGSFFLYLLAYRLFNDWLIGFLAGIIFLLLPSHVESVAWISVQLHLLASLLFIVSLVVYERFTVTKKTVSYFLALILAFLSLLTKEVGVTFFAGFFLIDLYKKTPWKIILKRLVLPVVLIGIYFALRFYATGIFFGYYASAKESKSFLEMLKMLTEMIVNLVFSYPERVIFTEWLMRNLIVYVFLAFALLLALWLFFKNQRKQLVFVLTMFFITCLPLLSVGYNNLGNEGERYVYLPSFFAALFVAIYLRAAFSRLRYSNLYLCLILLIIGIISLSQVNLKTKDWVLAGGVVNSALSKFSASSLSAKEQIIFIGLPDNLNGAQLFRNATKEALGFFDNTIEGGDRVLMSPLLTKENFNKEVLISEILDDQTILLKPVENTLIFGFPRVETKYGTATLVNFNRQNQTGDYIEFKISKDAVMEAKGEGKTVFLVWFSAGEFRKMQLF